MQMNGHCLATIFIPLLFGASSFLYLTSSASSSLEERIQLNVTEGVPKNTVVGSITKLDGYQYRLSEPNVHFHFNTHTGEIITAEQIDRENLLDGDSDTIDLVIVSKGVPAYFITVTINVLDVNDNAPKFPLPYQNVSLPESAKIGTQIVLIGANDRDAGINGKIVNYTLIGSDAECCQLLSQNEGSVLLLTLKNPLDREKKDLYILNISATDGGVPPLTGYTTVFLNVLDSNDNPPVFNETEYLVIVNESLPVGKPIFQIQATDLDLGENSRLSYSLVDNQDESFSINSETGLIETTKPLHCNKHYCKTSGECVGECILTVEATDHGLPSQRARAFVRIQVVNTNDHPPEIQIRFYTNNVGGYAIVNNQNPVGSVIALISVTDKDSGINGKTTLNITSGNELGHFRLDNSLGFSLLRTNASLNHREHHWYNLTLKAQDLGLKPKVTYKMLQIFVKGSRRMSPNFQKQHYKVSLAEDLPVGSKVIALQAHLENKPIFYSILSGNEFGWFHITEKTGLITTAAVLDYEFQSEHILIISAKSAALTEDFSTTKVYIQLMDVNDNSPEFLPDSLEASVPEDASIGTHITTIRTTDKDSGMNAVVKVQLIAFTENFQLNETTGDLILMKTLNREIQAEYSLDIIATDQGLPQRQTFTTVRIHVLDVNDELPKFYPTKYAVNILKSSAVGSAVATVKARDLDEGSNGLVTYYFEDSPVGIFDLDVNLGKIVLKKIPLGRNSINIVVKAKDADGKTSVNNATVQVNFIDSLYATPKFTQPKYEFVVQEDFGTGPHLARPIGSISATDFDSGSQLHYEIVDGNYMSLFEIGPYSGEIRSTRTLDFEEQRTHQLKVLAYGQQAVTSVLVSVNLEDVNDNDPKFLNNANIVEITDHTPVGFPILHTRAEDADSGMNGKINYYIVSDLRQAFLSVDSDSGLVTLTRPGHLVNPGQYEFSVHANDNGMPSRNDSTKITVLVKHDNNILESFQNQTLQFIIPEDRAVNEMVSKIGFGQYLHQYFIVDPTPDDLFGVFPDGWIYVKNALDFETTNYEKLSISIQNGKVKSLIEAEFFITDVNDNSPTCLKEIFQFEIAENMPPLSYVGTVEADDPDSKLNGIVRFRLANPEEDRFVLDSETGILRTLVQFDREEIYKMNKKSTIELQIEAYDLAEVHPLSTRCSVFVTVMDENDHRPQFTLDMYSASLLENKDIGSEVLRVSARDEDMNMNSMVKFEIASGNENNTFSLDPYTGKLTLSAPLDREIQAVYRITLRATDHGVPPLSGIAFATIVVTDVNDNAPKFTSQVESILIGEDTELGTCVHHFSAFDLDASKFGEISYSFSIGQVFGPFYLNPYDGCLMLIQPLDYETAKNYTLVVYASDAGTPKLSSSVVLRVLIKHIRNKMIDIGESLHTEVEENAPIGTEIMKLSPSDMNNEVENEIHFTILHQFPEVKFQIDHTKGTISICGPLDRETIDEYKLLVQAENAKHPKRSTRQTVTVTVNDVNDQAPEFYSYHAFLLPQSPRAGQFVGKLSVRDADVNNNISLSLLSSDNSDLFSLTEEGDMFVKKPILHPLPFYVLKVKAEDQPIFGSPLTENAEIHLIWNGEQRSEFEFEKEVYDFSLAETTPIGTQLGKLHLKNENSSMGIQYFVIGDHANQELFVDVEQNSGILSIARNLDCNFNSTGQFIITVVAISTQVQNNYQPLIATCKVNITITDENNTPPQLSEYFYKFHIAEDVPPGTEVGFIKAVDVDSNTKLLFSILEMENLFTIHPSLGIITTTSKLDREEITFHYFTVQISDGINVISAPVEVIVTDVNDNAPVFQNETFIFHLSKSVQKEHIIGIIRATDNDAGNNGKITYHLQAPEPHLKSVLTLDSVNGFIGIKSTWNFDKIPLIHFKVCATDNGFPSLKSTAQVIIVFEEDRRLPVFKDSSYIISVQENVSVNSELLKLNLASDQENLFYYTILFGDPLNQFWISRKGILYVNKALDRETRHEHHLTVIAHDEVTLEKSHFTASATIKIILIDINDNAPVFTSSNMAILHDNSPVGTAVMTVKATDPDEGLNGHVQYFIDSSSAGDFSLDPVYGTLRVNAMLNKKSYKLTIWAYDQGENQLKTSSDLNVVLLDTSVNHFILEADSTEITIFENEPVGKVLLNVKVNYEKDTHNESALLWIEQSENSDDFLLSQNGQLTIARPLSYIRKPVYILKLYGKGTLHSNPSDDNISSLVVTIRLKDVNDNSPIFIQNPIYIDVVENTAMDNQFTIIGRIKAIDKDHSHNSQIFYSIVQGNTSIFQIDSASGELFMTGILDREECESYTLEIQAIDSGFPPLSSKATVFINVIDLNDNPPIFDQSHYRAFLSENQPPSTKVVQIHAIDKDSGVNGVVKYKMLDNSVPFVINEETGWLSTTESLDRETQKQWNIWVLAEDCGLYNKHTSKVEIQIIVNDENDNAPIFHNQQENIYVKNSLLSGDFVYAVDASDLDEGKNSLLKFYLNGKDADKFIINVSTGVIVSKADLKLWNSYRLTVEVSDHGFPEKQSFLSLQFITRPPSEFPVFQSDFQQVYSIAENKQNTFVTLAVARSSKQAPFNRIRYSIASGNIGQAFTIDSESGELFTSENIDYETHCHYELWIAAVDNDSPPMISFLKLHINVEDVNDNSPVFNQSIYEVSIPEEEPEFFYITQVTATDLDSENNGLIEYSIDKNQSNVCDLFQIDPTSGIITTKVPLDRETKAQYHFVVVAKDQGMPALFGYAVVVVNLEDKNDNAPRFTHLFSAHVREDAPLDTFITQIVATDLDEVSDNIYILENGNDDTFRIEKDTGRIFVNKSLDRETISEYAIKVSVLDNFWKVMTSLTITVDDVNDNAPVFSKHNYSFYVPETKSTPGLIGRLEATDADSQENSRITYKMYSQSSQFSIDSVTGAIYSHKELIYYNTSELNIHHLKIIAHDSGRPVLSSITTVSVFVLPCDAKLINLQKPSKLIPVQVGTPASTMIYQVQNKVKCAQCKLMEIRYSLKQEENWFEIDPKTGWIMTNTTIAKDALDRKFFVKIVAEHETVTDEIEIGIVITEENRYSPRFLSSNYTINILKNTSLNATIFTAIAQDNDSGLNGLIQYESACVDVFPCPFAIDSDSGAVKLISPVNLYDHDSYVLKIKATDCAHHPKTSHAALTVLTQRGYSRIATFPHQKDNAFVHPSSGVNFTVYTFAVENSENMPSSQCEYKIMKGNEKQLFYLNMFSGQLVLVSPIGIEDYKSTMPLLVRCINPNTLMFSEMTLYVHIGTVHENFKPTFARRVYKFHAHAMESLIGFVKVQHEADDYRYFLGISGLKSNLEIDANSGAVIMKKQIPSKMTVTVLSRRSQFKSAFDFDVATLTVRPTDNGTFPSFDQTAYNVTISENSAIGTKVIAPIINGPLGHYCRAIIVDGNAKSSFMVDRRAVITVKGELDYESQSVYELLLALVCLEEDQWLSTCQVRIDISDVNDNGPQLHESNRVGYVMENDPAGTHVLTLLPYDLDSSVNQGPFKFKMLHSEQLPFDLDPQSGILKTTRPLDREFQEEYIIAVSIADNGIPPKTTMTSIKIVILDMNDMAPESEMLHVTVLSAQGAQFYGVSADVHPLDMDLIGNYSCQPIRTDHPLKVDAKCTLLIGSIPSDHVPVLMHLNGDDGKHLPVDFDLSIKFLTYTNYTAQNSVILHFDLMKQNLLEMAIQPLQQALEKEGYSSLLTQAECKQRNCSAWMTLYDSSHHIMPASELTASRIQLIWNRLKLKLDQVALSHVQHGMCTANSCLNGGICIEITESSGSFSYFRENENIFIFPKIAKSYRCDCGSTYTGEFCETTVDRCAINSCLNGGTCFHDELQLKTRCLCPEGYEGSRCENDVDECTISNPCQNNAHCENTDGSYRCICVAGYFGSKCEMPIDRCASNPCLNGGTCVADFDGYKCQCSYAYTGRNCEISSYGFQELSYIELSGLNVRKNELSFEFSTLRRNALLLYWSGTNYRSNSSYVVVDISNGQLRLACSASNGQKYSSTLPRNVTNARWHKLVLRHQLKSIGISISECGKNKCTSCDTGNPDCEITFTTCDSAAMFDDFDDSLFLGSANLASRIQSIGYETASPNFLGCIRDLSLNGSPLNAKSIRSQSNLLDHCPRQVADLCGHTDMCKTSEQCLDFWDRTECICRGNFISSSCEQAEQTYSLNNGFISYDIGPGVHVRSQFPTFDENAFETWAENELRLHHQSTLPALWLNILFRTTSRDGILFFSSTGVQFSLIDIVDGFVRYISRTDDLRTVQLNLDEGPTISDGNWHMVSLAKYPQEGLVEFRIDDHGKDAQLFTDLHDFYEQKLTSCSLGGTRNVLRIQGKQLNNFQGCIRRFILNGQLQPMEPSHRQSNFLTVRESQNVLFNVSCANAGAQKTELEAKRQRPTLLIICITFSICLVLSSIGCYFFLVRRYRKSTKAKRIQQSVLDSRLGLLDIIRQADWNFGSIKDPDYITKRDRTLTRLSATCSRGNLCDSGISLDTSTLGRRNPTDTLPSHAAVYHHYSRDISPDGSLYI